VLAPFIEQVDPRIEQAARVLGAGTIRASHACAGADSRPPDIRSTASRTGAHNRHVFEFTSR
jgi:hypothetical protein